MENIERRVRREVRAMTRREVIMKVLARQLTWLQAAQVLGITVASRAAAACQRRKLWWFLLRDNSAVTICLPSR